MSGLTREVGPKDHTAGPDDAPVTLVEYGDFECPHCGRAYPVVHAIRRRMGDRLRFAFRHFPLTDAHPHALHAAEAAEAAAVDGRFWEMHDLIFEHQDQLEDRDLVRYAEAAGASGMAVARALEEGTFAPRVREDFRGGVRSGVNGTPTFFINGRRYDGPWHIEAEFLEALATAAAAGRR